MHAVKFKMYDTATKHFNTLFYRVVK